MKDIQRIRYRGDVREGDYMNRTTILDSREEAYAGAEQLCIKYYSNQKNLIDIELHIDYIDDSSTIIIESNLTSFEISTIYKFTIKDKKQV